MSKYKPSPWKASLCDDLIKRFSTGGSRIEFIADHNICEETFSTWVRDRPGFGDAYLLAKAKALAWYTNLGRTHLEEHSDDVKLNLGMYNRTMNTRFNLPEQRKLKVKGISKKKVADKMNAVLKCIENGELTGREATQISRVVEGVIKVKEHSELEERISQIEQAQKIGVGDDDFEDVKD